MHMTTLSLRRSRRKWIAAGLSLAALAGMLTLGTTTASAAGGCHKVGVVGDSLSDYPGGARLQIEADLLLRGMPYYINTSNGRSIRTPGTGTDARTGNGIQAIVLARRSGADCIIIALGGNDAAKRQADRRLLSMDIDAAMAAAGPTKVDWITPSSNLKAGPWADSKMAVFRDEVSRAEARWPNLDVNHWERVPQILPLWWSNDNLHLNTGNFVRGAFTVSSAFTMGSR